MGESRRRKQSDPNWGNPKNSSSKWLVKWENPQRVKVGQYVLLGEEIFCGWTEPQLINVLRDSGIIPASDFDKAVTLFSDCWWCEVEVESLSRGVAFYSPGLQRVTGMIFSRGESIFTKSERAAIADGTLKLMCKISDAGKCWASSKQLKEFCNSK